ncbi:hypothetical protein K458DRAFT_128122 [Lentithecium fluviatile CBS 122367]|uniref:Uncharacterized protein n=1 Tax=Lentithecium fluviatile CBS 122367 TaxID=1168545 RepID=A0A6G1JGV6_9PLEO|nr:hypothetical protein K458DRAFT_128122 [Lentithecium fluviatile CBS 122367]
MFKWQPPSQATLKLLLTFSRSASNHRQPAPDPAHESKTRPHHSHHSATALPRPVRVRLRHRLPHTLLRAFPRCCPLAPPGRPPLPPPVDAPVNPVAGGLRCCLLSRRSSHAGAHMHVAFI